MDLVEKEGNLDLGNKWNRGKVGRPKYWLLDARSLRISNIKVLNVLLCKSLVKVLKSYSFLQLQCLARKTEWHLLLSFHGLPKPFA